MIQARNLTKRYGSTTAVDDLSFDVLPGRVTGFLGPNGAGKSTTMRMILGLDDPTRGQVLVNGTPYRQRRHPLREVGAHLDARAFLDGRSAYDHLLGLAASNHIPRQRVETVLDLVGLSNVARKRAGGFSMGMGQRLGIAVALLGDPGILILDEPTNGLDPQGVVEMRSLIRRLGTGPRTVLLSSHLLSEMEQVCDRVGIIRQGRLVSEGTVDELRGEPAVTVRATPLDAARQTLERMLGAGAVTAVDGTLRVAANPERAADINAALVQAHIRVSELRPAERSLEDVFLQVTGEGEAA